MNLPDFDYYAPESLTEATRLLAEFGPKAKVLAGGTDLLHKMKHGQLAPEVIVSLNNLRQLKEIKYQQGRGLVLGARVTHNDIAGSALLRDKYCSLAEAARNMANNQIRNTGSLGGNIVNAVPSADLPPILIALGAQVKLVGREGARTLPLEEFFSGVHSSVILTDEILTEVIIPDQPTTGSTYIRFGLRRSGALAVVGVAVAVTMEEGTCREARIALGSAGPVFMRARGAEAVLRDRPVSDQLIEEAALCASRECRPRSSIRGSAEYRRNLIKVLTGRALGKAVSEGHV